MFTYFICRLITNIIYHDLKHFNNKNYSRTLCYHFARLFYDHNSQIIDPNFNFESVPINLFLCFINLRVVSMIYTHSLIEGFGHVKVT